MYSSLSLRAFLTNEQFERAFPYEFETYKEIEPNAYWEVIIPSEESSDSCTLRVSGNDPYCGCSCEFGNREFLLQALEDAGLNSLLEEY